MFEEIGEIRRTRKTYNAEMFLSGVETFRELEEMEVNALRDGALTQKHKELIALGIATVQGCYG
jgi:alkylhydroperoxidase/carboxymuconolactone decarboxylase family protein YurZ